MNLSTDLRRHARLPLSLLAAMAVGWLTATVTSAAPPTLNFQGRISTDHLPVEGPRQFKFALVDGAGSVVWVHAADLAPADGEPDTALTLHLHHGHFAVQLGEDMNPLPPLTDTSLAALRLRIWFGEGDQSPHPLQPDTPLIGWPLASRAAVAAETLNVNGPVSVLQIAGRVADSVVPTNLARLDSSPVFSGPVTATRWVGAGVESWFRTADADVLTRPNLGYLVGGEEGPVRVHLPADGRAGDVVRVRGVTTGGWGIVESEGITLAVPGGYLWQVSAPNRQWLDLASSADGLRLLGAVPGIPLQVSRDGGVTWEERGSAGRWLTVGCSADGQVMVAGQVQGSLWRSADGGVTWRSLDLSGTWASLAASEDGSRWLAANSQGSLWRSVDAGVQWTPILIPKGSGGANSGRAWVAVASSADGQRLTAAESGGWIWTSADGGLTWIQRHQPGRWSDVASSADGTRLVAVQNPLTGTFTSDPSSCASSHLWISTDSGETWSSSGPPGCYEAVAASADGRRIFAHPFGKNLFLSEDGGRTWDYRAVNFAAGSLATSADGRRLIGASISSPLYRSLPEARGGLGSDMAWQCLGDGRWRGIPLGTVDFGGTLDPAHLASIDGASLASGTLPLDRFPPLTLLNFQAGIFLPTQVPSRLTLNHRFPDGLQIGGPKSEPAPLSVGRDQANARFGYALSLHDHDGAAWWKIGADDQGRLSLGAAGLRDDDLSIDRATGNVGIGTTSSEGPRLRVGGNLGTTGAAHFGGTLRAQEMLVISDARRKTRIASVTNTLPALERLQGVHFRWRAPENPEDPPPSADLQSGFLAQEVATVFPEAVETNATGLLRLNYQSLTPVLVEALKQIREQLHERLVATDATLAQLETEVARLENKRSTPSSSPAP